MSDPLFRKYLKSLRKRNAVKRAQPVENKQPPPSARPVTIPSQPATAARRQQQEAPAVSRDRWSRLFHDFYYGPPRRVSGLLVGTDAAVLRRDVEWRRRVRRHHKKRDKCKILVEDHLRNTFRDRMHPLCVLIGQFANLFKAVYFPRAPAAQGSTSQRSRDTPSIWSSLGSFSSLFESINPSSSSDTYSGSGGAPLLGLHEAGAFLRSAVKDVRTFCSRFQKLTRKVFPEIDKYNLAGPIQRSVLEALFPYICQDLFSLYRRKNVYKDTEFASKSLALSDVTPRDLGVSPVFCLELEPWQKLQLRQQAAAEKAPLPSSASDAREMVSPVYWDGTADPHKQQAATGSEDPAASPLVIARNHFKSPLLKDTKPQVEPLKFLPALTLTQRTAKGRLTRASSLPQRRHRSLTPPRKRQQQRRRGQGRDVSSLARASSVGSPGTRIRFGQPNAILAVGGAAPRRHSPGGWDFKQRLAHSPRAQLICESLHSRREPEFSVSQSVYDRAVVAPSLSQSFTDSRLFPDSFVARSSNSIAKAGGLTGAVDAPQPTISTTTDTAATQPAAATSIIGFMAAAPVAPSSNGDSTEQVPTDTSSSKDTSAAAKLAIVSPAARTVSPSASPVTTTPAASVESSPEPVLEEQMAKGVAQQLQQQQQQQRRVSMLTQSLENNSVDVRADKATAKHEVADQVPYQAAIDCLKMLEVAKTPWDKLQCVVDASQEVCTCVDKFYQQHGIESPLNEERCIGADDLLSIMSYLIIKARLSFGVSEAEYIEQFSSDSDKLGKGGYFLATLQASIELISGLDKEKVLSSQQI